MKQKIVFFILLTTFFALECMEQEHLLPAQEKWLEQVPFDPNAYPANKGRMRVEGIVEALMIPEDKKKDVDSLFNDTSSLVPYYDLSSSVVAEYSLKACHQKDLATHKSVGRFPVTPSKKHFIGIPRISNAVRSNLSSLGYDPYTAAERNNPEIIKKALDHQPTIHNLTTVVAQRLLKKFSSKGDPVIALESWIYPLYRDKKPFDDRYYVPVHECPPTGYKSLDVLTEKERKDFFEDFDLIGFESALRYISFPFPDAQHLLVNPESKKVIIVEPISANNEGVGPHRKYGNAILARDAHDFNKAMFNDDNPFDGARRTFEGVLKQFCPERVSEWNKLYETEAFSEK